MLYKQGYDNLTQALRKDKNIINEKNLQIENLKNEIEKMKDMSRFNICNNNNNRKAGRSYSNSSNAMMEGEKNENSVFLQAKKFFDKKEAQKFATSEWLELLTNLDIKLTDIEKLCKNEVFGRVLEGIELLNKLVMDRNMQLSFLMQENEKLNHKNSKLDNNNIKLKNTVGELKSKIKKIKTDDAYDPANTSMVTTYT
jgi:hypothetical protein